jgi:hypothetical protein
MTEIARQYAPPPRRRPAPPPRRKRIWPTVAASVATFAVLFEFLAFQLSSGNDPALGASVNANAAQTQPDPRPIVNRRVIKTRVVPLPPEESDGATTVVPSTSAPAPVTPTAPAPVTSAPAPVAPAPVTSSS